VDGAVVGAGSLWPACLLSQIGILLYYVSFHMLVARSLGGLPLAFFCVVNFHGLERKKGIATHRQGFIYLFILI
jgi:hypothetical protein